MADLSKEAPKVEKAKESPASIFDSPADVLSANLSKDEKRAILEQWKVDAIQLQQAADENMTGGEPSRIEDVVEAMKILDAN